MKGKFVTKKIAAEIAQQVQTDYEFARNDGRDPETARLNARQNAIETFTVERGYDREGVVMAIPEPKEENPSDCGCSKAAAVVGAKKTRTKVKVETEKTETTAAVVAAENPAPAPCAPALTVTKPQRYAACRFAAKKIGPIDSTEKVNALVGSYLAKEDQEVCLVIPLDVHFKLRGAPAEIARGARSGVNVSYVEILRVIAVTGASKIILAHNHPGDSPKPSAADKSFTRGVDKALKVATNGEVKMLDHVVFTTTKFHSIREHKTFSR